MKVGCLGAIPFEVSEKRIQTIQKATWSGSVNIATHKRHLTDALTEYTGRNPDSFSLEMQLSAWLGVNPMDAVLKIWKYEREATPVSLVIGTRAYGKYRWLIQSHKVTMEKHDKNGDVMSVTVSVELIEYTRR